MASIMSLNRSHARFWLKYDNLEYYTLQFYQFIKISVIQCFSNWGYSMISKNLAQLRVIVYDKNLPDSSII